MAPVIDIALLSLSSFLGNVGVALTGFGMAIIYLFVWQIAVIAGYDSNFKYAVFIQALALFSAQPLLLYKAEIREYASHRMLRYFIPITIISTPLGQITGDRVSTDIVEAVGGVLVTFVAIFEIYQKRDFFASWLCRYFSKKTEKNPETQVGVEMDKSECESEGSSSEGSISIDHLDTLHDLDTTLGEGSFSALKLAIILEEEKTTLEEDESDKSISIGCFAASEKSIGIDHFATLYDLGGTIGEGSFSVVKKGTSKATGRSYAIKVVPKATILEEDENKLEEEIAIMRELTHPNILRLYDVLYEPDYYLVTENMAGGDLLGRINSVSFFSERQGRRICKSLLEAIGYMHSKRIAHRDLKPENVLLDSDSEDAVVKLADFGFAKREEVPNSFTTMCGTAGYVAPEILSGVPYGIAVDMWSMGIIAYILLVGYQPFRGENEDALKRQIRHGDFEFDEKFWSSITTEAKSFISSVLTVDPAERLSANEALERKWFTLKDFGKTVVSQNDTPVFFMIGSQRSGSNWLRTMLDEREDLVGPHPPHIMREFMPILDKFGDMSADDNFRVLIDNVCTFVERNQVPWTNKHGVNIKFPRTVIHAAAVESCERIRKNRAAGGEPHALESGLYLLSAFDAVMNFFTKANGKRIWMCKSMGMSIFHDLLLDFYGEKRLRYIYLVRDPRDVAMSFMKTPVGDCHYHAIIAKWTKLQSHALRIIEERPELVHKVHYEEILQDKETVVEGVYAFIGERRFGGITRQASVLFMNPTEDLINGAKKGREAMKACNLSFQFQNLCRGVSFAIRQHKKWLDLENGMKMDDIQLLESVAHEMMDKLGYDTHLVGVTTDPTEFTAEDLRNFIELNEQGIQKMNDDLQKENPGDFERRKYQAEVLTFSPTLFEDWSAREASSSDKPSDASRASYLSDDDLELRLDLLEPERIIQLQEGRRVRWATASQRGYYPYEPDKPNQDASKAETGTANGGIIHWFAVFDGHGPDGHKCSEYATDHIPKLFASEVSSGRDVKSALEKSHLTTHEQILSEHSIDTRQSGTTAVSLLLENDKCVVSNVGDSTCILGSRTTDGAMAAKHLCTEQTPLRADERERIKRAGGLIMTADQRDGLVPMNEDWNKNEDPPRIWSSRTDGENKFPGCGFTRSIGDSVAHSLGVTATPEIFEHAFDTKDRVLIVASDGITEFMDANTCVEIACRFQDPSEAALALVKESTKRWIEQGDYMDDMTAIVLFLDSPAESDEIPQDARDDVDLEARIKQCDSIDDMTAITDFSPAESDEIPQARDDMDLEVGSNSTVVVKESVDNEEIQLGASALFWTLFAGAASGFLGGLCGIRGPPIILYFLHPPFPVSFTKKTQRATGACITFTNVAMRVAYYLIDTMAFDGEGYLESSDWVLYAAIIISSVLGVLVGSKLFEYMKDSKTTVRGILAIFLLLCGVSLLMSSFMGM